MRGNKTSEEAHAKLEATTTHTGHCAKHSSPNIKPARSSAGDAARSSHPTSRSTSAMTTTTAPSTAAQSTPTDATVQQQDDDHTTDHTLGRVPFKGAQITTAGENNLVRRGTKTFEIPDFQTEKCPIAALTAWGLTDFQGVDMTILPCSAPNCAVESYVKKRQLCRPHYNRFMRYGDFDLEANPAECRRCGDAIQRDRKNTGPSPQYCTNECQRLAAHERRIASGVYVATNYAKRQANKQKPLNRATCIMCANAFESKHSSPKFCSTTCNNQWRDEHNELRCSEADCDRGVRAKGICAMHWRRAARAEGREVAEPWNESRKANYHKRRAQKLSLPADIIRPADVYERDEWVCGICSTLVDRKLAYPDPMSPSLDHVLPLSLGGHHAMENVTLAHLSCNVRKGNRVDAGAMSA